MQYGVKAAPKIRARLDDPQARQPTLKEIWLVLFRSSLATLKDIAPQRSTGSPLTNIPGLRIAPQESH